MDKDKIVSVFKRFNGSNGKPFYIGLVLIVSSFMFLFSIAVLSDTQKIKNGEAVSPNVDTSLMADINAGRIFITLSESNLTELQLKLLKNAGYVFYADDVRYFGLEHTKVFVKNSELAHSVIEKDKLKDLQELKSF